MDLDGDDTYALIVVGDHARDEYVRLMGRLGIAADAFADTSTACRSLRAHAPSVSILEVESGGCALLRELRDRFGPDTPVVLVSAERTAPSDVVAGLLVGADDYAAESMDADEFIARVRRLVDRTRRSTAAIADVTRLSTLTAREREVLGLLTNGLSQKQLANRMGISVKTAGTHVQNLLAKLGLHSRLEAVALAVRAGAVSAGSGPVWMGASV